MQQNSWIVSLAKIATTVLIARAGAISMEMYTVTKGGAFLLKHFLFRLFISGVVGYIVEGAWPNTRPAEGSVIAISGVISYQIMDFFIQEGPSLIEMIYRFFLDKFSLKKPEKEDAEGIVESKSEDQANG